MISLHRPPTRRDLIVDAIALGVNTSNRIADLFGISIKIVQSELYDMAARKRIRRAGSLKENRRGKHRQVWEVA